MEQNPILNSKLSSDGSSPLYFQLLSVIKRYISAGLLQPGDLLPSEAEMTRSFGISRSTVRLAMGALEEEGLVTRHRGRGTFVAEPKMRRRTENLWSFTAETEALGLEPSSTLLEFTIIHPAEDIVTLLELKQKNTDVYRITRIRRVNGEPLMLETSFYPTYIYPNLSQDLVEANSIYSLLSQVGIVPHSAVDSYEAIKFSHEEIRLLDCKAGSIGYFHQRQTRTEAGQLFELTQSLIRGDRVRLDITLEKDEVIFARSIDGQVSSDN